MKSIDKAKKVMKQRGKVYEGDNGAELGFTNLGRIWAALLSDWTGETVPDIPPHVVSLMMIGLKLSRAARPTPKPDDDNYVDMHVYAELCVPMDPTLPEGD